ncbi:amidohydrolase family protein [Pararhodonellum marinum]|uniref:hypothetical protein n=1 Tax=Pararhodonellum marinum TaxID=2755358 RepID=UPI00188F0C0B|nr:hypothetical protein [Pararhodonellum marinum]
MKYADLHCHNHMRAYFWSQGREPHFRRNNLDNAWTVISSNLRSQSKAGMAAAYSQCDLVKAWNGGVRLTFNSLYPIEKGFFVSPESPSDGKSMFLREVIRKVTHHRLPLRTILQMVYMRIPDRLVKKFQDLDYDYWEAIQEEVEFLDKTNGVEVSNQIYTPGFLRRAVESRSNRRRLRPLSLNATGIYRIPKNLRELETSLEKEEITMVMTIEGAHALGTDQASLPIEKFLKRVDFIKKDWPFPIFFITFAHHFNNFLCGHAHSIPDIGKWLLNQDNGKNDGFNENGWKVIRRFLSLNQDNQRDDSLGYRILIDVKHMSALARKEFYEEIVLKCYKNGDVIPVIASHCGFSGKFSLDDHIQNFDLENDSYFDVSGNFNAWNINMCQEDVRIIFKTRGLFGLSFDQRIMGIPKKEDPNASRNNIRCLWDNIKYIVKTIYEDTSVPASEKSEIWDCIMIGTDFEGLIDPVTPYPTVLEFCEFEIDLVDTINENRSHVPGENQFLAFLESPEDTLKLVRKLCYDNAEKFVKKHYFKTFR